MCIQRSVLLCILSLYAAGVSGLGQSSGSGFSGAQAETPSLQERLVKAFGDQRNQRTFAGESDRVLPVADSKNAPQGSPPAKPLLPVSAETAEDDLTPVKAEPLEGTGSPKSGLGSGSKERKERMEMEAADSPKSFFEKAAETPYEKTEKADPSVVRTRRALRSKASWRQRYELGPGDVLNFGLHGKPDLYKQDVVIAPDGTVSYLQAKQIDVRGKTIDELRAEMEQVLSSYHREPRLILTPAKLGSKSYTILGEVKQNGSYPLGRPTTLLEALAKSGGFTVGESGEDAIELADLGRSFVVRRGNRLPIDMEALYLRGDFSQNVNLEPGDYIYIASKLRSEVYVFGYVNSPGVLAMQSDMTAVAAVAGAEGFAEKAWRDRVLVIRGRMNDPQKIVVSVNKIVHGKSSDLDLEPGDIVYVHHRPWAFAEEILDTAIRAFIDGSVAGILAEESISISSGGAGF